MARREDSAASRSSASPAGARTRGGTARARSDGKVDIYCPQCGAHFRILGTALDSKVQCTECTRSFFAKTTAGKRTKGPDYTKVYLGFGVGALLIIGTLVLINQSGAAPVQRTVNAAPSVSQLDLDKEARRDQAQRWARAVGQSDMVTLRSYSDLQALAGLLGLDAQLRGDALETAVLAALKTNDTTRLLHEMDVTAADISSDAVQAGKGPALLFLINKPGISYYDAKAGAQITLQWRMEGSQMKVEGFALTAKPILRGRRPGDEDKYFKPSEEIARPKDAEIEINGRKKKVREAEPVAIAHLKDTTPEQQQKIDALVADLLRSADPESPGNLFVRSTAKIKEIGRPAIARVINALHDLYGDVNGNNMKISQVTRSLLDVSGMAFAYDHVGTGDAQKDKAARESVIRQWFAWWWRYANSDYQDAIDQSEDLLDSPTRPNDKK